MTGAGLSDTLKVRMGDSQMVREEPTHLQVNSCWQLRNNGTQRSSS